MEKVRDRDRDLKRYTLLVSSAAGFLAPFMGSSVNLAIPSIGLAFNASTYMLSWLATSYILASAALLLPFGRLADIIGRKKIFVIGIITFCLFTLLCGLAWSIESLVVFRVLQGIASAMLFSTSMAILTSVFPPYERGKVLGINAAAVYVGLSLGPVLGGVINHNFGWKYIFLMTALISLGVVVLALGKLKGEWTGARGEKYDFGGVALYVVGLVALTYGFSSVAASQWAWLFMGVGLVLIVLFVMWEVRVRQPMIDMHLFTNNPPFVYSNLAALINYSATFAVGFLLSLHLQLVMGYNSQAAGLILLAQPVLMAVVSPISGRFSDLVEPRILSSWGMALTALTLVCLCFISATMPLWILIADLAVLGIGLSLFSTPNSNAVMSAVEKSYYGVAASALGTMRMVGQALSMAIVTMALAMYVGHTELTAVNGEHLLAGARLALIIMSVLCFVGIFASLARGKAGGAKDTAAKLSRAGGRAGNAGPKGEN